MKRYHLLLVATCVAIISFGGRSTLRVDHASKPPHRITEPEFLKKTRPQWADSVLATLSLEDRIAQLMMVAAWSNKSHAHENDIGELIKQHNIGGLIFLQGGPNRQAALTNRYQGLARTPLLIGQDLEWGLAMRLDSTMRFPKEMTLGAMESDRGIEAMGAEIARQMHRLGVQVSFSPVADVNIDPANPVINDRSFGEDREAVARKAIAYMRGLQNGGVIATAKHFPGHGDTDTDSHLGLPMIAQPRARLDSVELYPFRRLIAEGLNAVMVAHLEVHALDTTAHLPSTLSKPIVTGLLQDEMGFHGLVFTDALNMKGVSEAVPAKARRSGEIELRALLAGNDVLLFPQDPVKAIERIKQAVDSGEIAREVIDAKCLKLLRAKEWAGLSHLRPVEVANIAEELAPVSAKALRRSLFADALTLLRNDGTLPIANVGKQRIASLVIGDSLHCTFQRDLERYAPITEFRCDKIMKRDSAEALLHKLKDFDLVIASVHNTSFKSEKEYGIPQLTLDFLRRLGDQNKMAFVLFANPYRLVQAYGAQRWNAMICAYEENDDTQDLTAQALFGAIPMSGTLPVTASAFFKKGDGIRLTAIQRLSYALPEEDSVSTGDLRGIDTVVGEGIAAKAFPGCEVLVAHNGKVIWNKAYGSPTYDNARAVRTDDIYDLASVTKVASTTLAVMKLVDEKKLDLDKTLGDYMPDWKSAHPLHARMLFRDVLTHQAGLKAFVPFYLKLLKDGKLKPGIAADSADEKHPLRVAMGIYLPAAYRDSVIKWMFDAPVGPSGL